MHPPEVEAGAPGRFGRVALTVMRHPRVASVCVGLVTVLAILLALRLTVDPNILVLLPADDPTTVAIQQLNEEEGGANLLTIAVKGEEAQVVDTFMRDLSARLNAMETVEFALYDVDPDVAWRVGLMQLKPEELASIRDRLVAANALGAAAANPFVASRLLDLGPLTARLRGDSAQTRVVASSDGMARVLVRPVDSAYNTRFVRPFMADIYGLLDEMNPEAQGLEVAWVGGAYRHAMEDMEGITHDLRWTALASLGLVLLLISVAYRDVRAIMLIFTPLLVGTVWTVGYAGLSVGTLNTFTCFFTAVLIGLGVDFSIHLYSRYREERARGGDLEGAVVRAWDRAGPPCFIAACTSSAGFCALWSAGFGGFQQLGTLLSGGVLICFVASIVVLPLVILFRETQPHSVPLRRFRLPRGEHPPTYRLAPLGLVLTALVTISAASLLPRIEFEYDLSELRQRGMAFADLDEEQRSLAQDSYAPIMLSYPDAVSHAADHQRLTEAVAADKIPEIAQVISLYSVLPIDQQSRIAVLGEIAELAQHENVKYLPVQVRENLARLTGEDLRPLTADDLPVALRHVLGAREGQHRILLVPDGNMWDLRNNVDLYEAVKKWVGETPAAGEFLASAVLYRLMQGDLPRVAGLALCLVLLLTWFDVRSWPRALGAVAALVCGMCWAGAGLSLFRVRLSMMNFVGIPILMGIGVDVVIHLLHRLNEEGPGRIRRAMETTGWAAGLSTLTTVFSFASLSLATNQGVRSLGLLILLGLSLVTVSAFLVVPLGWMTAWKVKGELPDSLDEIYDTEEVSRTANSNEITPS